MRTRSPRPRRWLAAYVAGLSVVALAVSWPALPASAADQRLERAQAERAAVQERLDELLQRIDTLEREAGEVQAELDRLQAAIGEQQAQAQAAGDALAARIRQAYIAGTVDPALALLASGSPREATEQARLLGMLGQRSRASLETATSARVRTQAAAQLVSDTAEELAARHAELEAVRAEVATLLAAAQAEEQQVRATIAAEQAAAREAAEREARSRASRQAAQPAQPATPAALSAPVVGNVSCPVGSPRSFSDTYGAPRSGGRSHKGVDILAPHGTPIYAYENGTIARMNGNRLGGISLYLRGASGNLYYYTHLSGYVSGLSAGESVAVGEHIAFVGDTGNARGIPHLHWEVMPGGGRNVNPYPYARRACG